MRGFEEMHNTTWPAASAEGGGPAAQAPYATGQWGQFFGYPTLIVISPDRSVQFDIWGDNIAETVELLNDAIIKTEAEGLLSSVEDNLTNVTAFEIFPNPTIDNASIDITLDDSSEVKIEIYNTVGQMIQSIYNGELNSGAQRIEFNASELPAGINWIKVEMNGEAHMEQLIKQ